MIVCPKCKSENMLGAIFCRGCGEKLNLDELRPEDIAKAIGKTKKKGASVLRNLIAFIALVVVLGTLAAIFIKPSFTAYDELPATEFAAAKQRMNNLLSSNRAGDKFTFSAAEVSHLAKFTVEMTREALETRAEAMVDHEMATDGISVPYDLSVNLLGDDRVRLVLFSKLYDKVPIYTVLEGTASGSADGGLWFVPEKYYAGRLPVYGEIFQDAVLQRFTALIDKNEKFNNNIRPRISGVAISTTEAVLSR